MIETTTDTARGTGARDVEPATATGAGRPLAMDRRRSPFDETA